MMPGKIRPQNYCDMRLESWNLRIHQAELRKAPSHGNTKHTITLGSDGAFGDISMVTMF
jgi:dihydroorotase